MRNTEVSVPYVYRDRIHHYYPDFYIPSIDTYIEIKGRETEIDEIKVHCAWEQGIKVVVLKENDLQKIFDFVGSRYGLHHNAGGNNFYLLHDKE